MMKKKSRHVYLDAAATTPIDDAILTAMKPWFTTHYANPSALHGEGTQARQAIDKARRTIADFLHTRPSSITFTGSATEANNIALIGAARAMEALGKHIITTTIEHSSVLEPLKYLETQGWRITYIDPDESGIINPKDIIAALQPDTTLISIMYANNEVGSIQPIQDIGRLLLQYRKQHNTNIPYIHIDACQGAAYLDMSVERMHADLLTINAHKIHGPKGVGVLYTRKGMPIEPMMFGGGQEQGLRSGTENVPAIIGCAKAIDTVAQEQEERTEHIRSMQTYFLDQVTQRIPEATLVGPHIASQKRLPNTLFFIIDAVEGETMVLYLNSAGIMASTGSACSTHRNHGSHVLQAIGIDSTRIANGIRLSFDYHISEKDIDYTVSTIRSTIDLLTKKQRI